MWTRTLAILAIVIPGTVAQSQEKDAFTEEEVATAWRMVKQHGCETIGYFDDLDDADNKPVGIPSTSLRTYRRFALGFPRRTSNADLARLAVSLGRLPGLTSIDLGNCPISNAGVKAIRKIPDLNAIFLDGTAVGDGIVTELAEFRKLRWLDLSNTKITDKGALELGLLGKLQTLHLADNPALTDAGVREFLKLDGLRTLNLAGTGIAFANQPELKALVNLTRLDLSRTAVGDDGLAALAVLKNLKELDLSDTQVSGKGFEKLAGVASLHTLWLADAPITNDGAKGIGTLKQIRTLYLEGPRVPPKDKSTKMQLTDTGLAEIGRCQSLRRLSLARTTTIRGQGLRELAQLPNLIELSLDGSAVEPRALPEVSETKTLRILNLARTQLTGDGLKTLTTLSDLRVLDLEGSKLNDAGTVDLAFLRTIGELNLRGTAITSAGVANLADLPLVRLDLSKTRVDPRIAKPLTNMKSLKTLILSETNVPEANIAAMQKSLPRCTIVGPAARKQPAPEKPDTAPRLPIE